MSSRKMIFVNFWVQGTGIQTDADPDPAHHFDEDLDPA